MPDPVVEMHSPSGSDGETAVAWDPVPEVIRYGVVVGHAGLAVPPLDSIMRGDAPSFALLGVPPRYSGAIDRSVPAGAGRQYGLVAYRGDGTLVAVPGVRVSAAAAAARDRDYYPLNVPALAPPPAPDVLAVAGAPDAPAVQSAPPPSPPPEARDQAVPPPPAPAIPEHAPPAAAPAQPAPPPAGPAWTPITPPARAQPAPVAAGPRVAASWVALERDPRAPEEGGSSQQAVLAALLDEAALALSPSWRDHAAASRLLDEAARMAPVDPRVEELQRRLQQGGARDAAALLREARSCLAAREYWRAVDLFEEVPAGDAGHAEARQEAVRARLLARWAAQMAGAESDAPFLARIGDEFAAGAPDLAAQSYAASFDARPTLVTLRAWLLALVRGGQGGALPAAARQGIQALRRAGRLPEDAAPDAALGALESAGADGLVVAVEEFIAAVAPPAPTA